jgi:hypothetical protein
VPGPSNLYGVANPVALPLEGIIFGPIACPSGVETVIATTAALIAPSAGYFYPMVWFSLTLACGAAVPTSLVLAFKIGAGSDANSAYFVPGGYMASTYSWPSCALVGPPSNVVWQGAGSVINLTCNPTAQAVNCYNINYVAALYRAPDQ